jgi:hypothetical protein
MSRAIRVRIAEVVLHGFDPRDRHAIGDALRAELAEMLAARGVGARSAMIPRVDGGTIRVQPRTKARGLGANVAEVLRR